MDTPYRMPTRVLRRREPEPVWRCDTFDQSGVWLVEIPDAKTGKNPRRLAFVRVINRVLLDVVIVGLPEYDAQEMVEYLQGLNATWSKLPEPHGPPVL